ncbi:MAG: hypothetical protein JXR76_25795 [Deltaproteobacteria bacterium]|nr:hypothetical protein [Deltaproteobacteria bacterium]
MSNTTKIAAAAGLSLILGCGQAKDASRQPDAKNNKPNIPANVEKTPEAPAFDASNITFKGPGLVLQKAFDDWKIASAPRYFGADNLYDLINGGSEIFVAYGFLQIVTTDYKHSAHPSITITAEVYDMNTPLGAFGRISKYLENLASPRDAGKGLSSAMESVGILGDGDLIFWKDKYIVHLMLMDEDPEATPDSIAAFSSKVIPKMGEAIFSNIKENGTIDMVSVFPTGHLVPRTEGYFYDFEAGDVKTKAFTARYKKDDIEWTLFVTAPEKPAAENAALMKAAKGTTDVMDIRQLKEHVFGATFSGDKKPDSNLIKAQLDELQGALSAKNVKDL